MKERNERREGMRNNRKNRKLLICAAALLLAAAMPMGEEAVVFAEQGFSRVPNHSAWDGTYYREDGQRVTVYDTDQDYVFLSRADGYGQEIVDILEFTNAEKTQAVSAASMDTSVVYTLSEDTLSINSNTSDSAYLLGSYQRRKNASSWRKAPDGTDNYLDEEGKILCSRMTPDGWYVDSEGKWAWQVGMMLITPGRYESMPAYSAREGFETWSFSMYSSEEASRPFNSLDDRVEVGCVDYTAYDRNMNPYYTKESLSVYNSPRGYVIEDVSGQEFAWLYPSIHGNDLMIQMYGTETYHTVRLVEDYSDFGG